MDIFYFTLQHGLRIVLHTICFCFFYLFSMKFMYNVNRTSSVGRIAPAHFLTDCWAILTGKDKQYILIFVTMAPSPIGGGRFCRVLEESVEEILGVCLI